MPETTTNSNKSKTTKLAAPSVAIPEYGLPKFEMPKFEMPNMEMPEAFREMAEKGVERTKEACAKAKVASDEAADLLENTYEAAFKRATDYNHKLFEIVRTNTGAAFGYANELLGVKSPSQFIELSTSQMRKQFETMSAQNKELWAITQEMASEAAETIKTGVSKAVNKAT
jgi:phasin